MIGKYVQLLIFSSFLIGTSVLEIHAEGDDLITNNAKLIEHIKRTDHILSSSLGTCSDETLQRITHGVELHFKYFAHCAIKPAPEDDCPEYIVRAAGTVDSSSWATIRELQLELQCTN